MSPSKPSAAPDAALPAGGGLQDGSSDGLADRLAAASLENGKSAAIQPQKTFAASELPPIQVCFWCHIRSSPGAWMGDSLSQPKKDRHARQSTQPGVSDCW